MTKVPGVPVRELKANNFRLQRSNGGHEACMLNGALELFRIRTEPNYIPRCRLEELATYFKDGLISDDKESAMEYFECECEMETNEKEFFGIENN